VERVPSRGDGATGYPWNEANRALVNGENGGIGVPVSFLHKLIDDYFELLHGWCLRGIIGLLKLCHNSASHTWLK
jgi:hypothetical protein